jgi:hypothetical protein
VTGTRQRPALLANKWPTNCPIGANYWSIWQLRSAFSAAQRARDRQTTLDYAEHGGSLARAAGRARLGRRRGVFDDFSEALEGAVPGGGDIVEEGASVVETLGFEGVQDPAAAFFVAYESGAFEHFARFALI